MSCHALILPSLQPTKVKLNKTNVAFKNDTVTKKFMLNNASKTETMNSPEKGSGESPGTNYRENHYNTIEFPKAGDLLKLNQSMASPEILREID